MQSELPLVGDKFLVTDGKGYDLEYVFDKPEVLKTRIMNGEKCDILITSSEPVIYDLHTEDCIFKEESTPIVRSQMALIVPDEEAVFPNLDEVIIHSEVEPEGYRPYADLLWEIYGEEGWPEEWGEIDGDLWIRSDFTGVAICSSQTEEGVLARLILNRYGQIEALLDHARLILEYGTPEEVISAVSDHFVTEGICLVTGLDNEQGVKKQISFNHLEDPSLTFQACRITSSENITEARELIDFLQGEHARRFFEDFGYECMR